MATTRTKNILNACCKSDIGRRRLRNEDTCAVSEKHGFFLVADGIGGLESGDVASRIFADTVTSTLSNTTELVSQKLVSSCFSNANRAIWEKGQQLHGQRMGCTAELLVFTEDTFILGHVGDSRTYQLSPGGEMILLTNDHSLVAQQISRGIITHEQAAKSRLKNVLLRAIGTEEIVEADIIESDRVPGALFLLCSDGLYSMVPESQIKPVLLYNAPLSFKAEMLISMANDAGGKDNISLCLIETL